jgi:hypothetical protein
MYTMVPRYVRDDMRWLADIGTTAISVGLLEQDLYASVRNIEAICAEADRAGLAVHVVPSRWAGLVAGSLKVPSQFTVTHPETWVLDDLGQPRFTPVSGPISSIHHPETFEFMARGVTAVLEQFPVAGIIWDEVKVFDQPDGRCVTGGFDDPDVLDAHNRDVAEFFSRLNARVRSVRPEIILSLFIYADADDRVLQAAAGIEGLDYFGCDGKAARPDDPGRQEHPGKTLLGPGERFLPIARERGVGTLMLIENHNTDTEGMATLDRRLPETLGLDVDHWIYYYYGRNCDDPDGVMGIMSRHLSNGARR